MAINHPNYFSLVKYKKSSLGRQYKLYINIDRQLRVDWFCITVGAEYYSFNYFNYYSG